MPQHTFWVAWFEMLWKWLSYRNVCDRERDSARMVSKKVLPTCCVPITISVLLTNNNKPINTLIKILKFSSKKVACKRFWRNDFQDQKLHLSNHIQCGSVKLVTGRFALRFHLVLSKVCMLNVCSAHQRIEFMVYPCIDEFDFDDSISQRKILDTAFQ